MKSKLCPDCRALVPDTEGPTHPYLGASAGCWGLYGEVLAREYCDFRYAKVHRLTVDAYAAQHPGRPDRRSAQSVSVHLVALHLVLEARFPLDQATKALSGLVRSSKRLKRRFDWLEPPRNLGGLTVLDIHAAGDAQTHCDRVLDWARCVWRAWEPHHDRIQSLAKSLSGS